MGLCHLLLRVLLIWEERTMCIVNFSLSILLQYHAVSITFILVTINDDAYWYESTPCLLVELLPFNSYGFQPEIWQNKACLYSNRLLLKMAMLRQLLCIPCYFGISQLTGTRKLLINKTVNLAKELCGLQTQKSTGITHDKTCPKWVLY